MRIRVSDPASLLDLCDFLSRRGCVAVEVGEDEAEILIPGAPSRFEAATMVMSEVGIWRAKRSGVEVVLEPE
jgi:acetolactate synthase small subunit